jgi:hypothetical protein
MCDCETSIKTMGYTFIFHTLISLLKCMLPRGTYVLKVFYPLMFNPNKKASKQSLEEFLLHC